MEDCQGSHRQWFHANRDRQDLHPRGYRHQQDPRSDMALLRLILYLWQLPQHLLGLLLLGILRPEVSIAFGRGKAFFARKMKRAISLGRYIIVEAGRGTPSVLSHEYGHTRQSLYLGPLYLLVIGLPSLIHACLYKPQKGNYYDFYTEKWADHLGGVVRNI